MATVFSCPGCRVDFPVPDSLVGQQVRCPSCRKLYQSDSQGLTSPPPTEVPSTPTEAITQDELPASARVISDPLGEFISCPICDEKISGHSLVCPLCQEPVDHRPRWQRRDVVPHRSGVILSLGIFSLIMVLAAFCPVFSGVGVGLGAAAWMMGNNDLARILRGEMDPDGQMTTKSGRNCGIIGVILNTLAMLTCFALIAITTIAPRLR